MQPGRSPSVAVIGSGRIAEEHLRFLDNRHNVELIAVCDLSHALAAYSAERFKAKSVFTNYRQMLDDARPDVVHICSPATTHASIARDCLKAGANVIVEKPITATFPEFQALWKLATDKGLMLTEDHNYLFNFPIPEMRRILLEGAIGVVKEIDIRASVHVRAPGQRYMDVNAPHSSHCMPAGIIHEYITHMCYLALHFFPGETSSGDFDCVHAVWSNHGAGELFRFDDLDAVLVSNDVHIHFRFCANTWPEALEVVVRGSKGTLATDVWHPYLRVQRPRGISQLSSIVDHWSNGWNLVLSGTRNLRDRLHGRTTNEGLRRFLEQTYAALNEGVPPPLGYAEIAGPSRLVDTLVSRAEVR